MLFGNANNTPIRPFLIWIHFFDFHDLFSAIDRLITSYRRTRLTATADDLYSQQETV